MQIALFGASGRTGQLLTERALAQGHTVTALVRSPGSYANASRVRVVQGDAFTPAAIDQTLEGADAVLSALGARSLGREDVLERAVPLIVAAMERKGVSRIVVLGSAGALDSALDKQPAWRRWLVEKIVYKTALKWPVASQRAQYAALAASSLDWTMVMPPMLTNGSPRGVYRVDGDALPRNGSSIARADVADFMMQQLTSQQWSRKGVYLSW
jgi:putative NADH-flavin reductase